MVAIFPVLPGQGITVHKLPKWNTDVAMHASGRESRVRRYLWPLWDFELTFDGMDANSPGYYGSLGAATVQELAGFYNQQRGAYAPFLYKDPTDFIATGQPLGTGDGATLNFTFTRDFGGYAFPVGAVLTASVYLDGVLQPGANYSVANTGSNFPTLVFVAAPGGGIAVTADFTFAYVCRFSEDVVDFEEFMSRLMLMKSLKFQSVRETVPYSPCSIILLAGTSWTVPDDWNSFDNSIELIGGGSGGGSAYGGAGGAYTIARNVVLTPGAVIPIIIGAGGAGISGAISPGSPGTATDFNGGMLRADYGGRVPGAGSVNGGSAAFCVPYFVNGVQVAQSGGNGGENLELGGGGAGGGGAGGPNGRGGSGALPIATQGGGGGGASDGGSSGFNSATNDGGHGGANFFGVPGGVGGITPTSPTGGAGSQGSGGGGGAVTGAGGFNGGNGSAAQNWNVNGTWFGAGSGGGGGAGNGFNPVGRGGDGGGYGGGGAGGGYSIPGGTLGQGGNGTPGAIVVTNCNH
jgi:uncharacterized protein (TIGR02217 family)